MLPRSCLRLADSKSNSSTRLPRNTTTLVSSGWAASMSILFAMIGYLHDRALLTSGGRRTPGPRRWHDRLVGDGGRRRGRAPTGRRRGRIGPGLALLVGVVRIFASGAP